jgi:hypothetical protein
MRLTQLFALRMHQGQLHPRKSRILSACFSFMIACPTGPPETFAFYLQCWCQPKDDVMNFYLIDIIRELSEDIF